MADPNNLKIDLKLTPALAGIDLANGQYVQSFTVDQKLGSPDYFSCELSSTEADEKRELKLLNALKPGTEVELKVGYDPEEIIFKGEVSYIEPHFAPGKMSVYIAGYDFSHRLTRGTDSQTFGEGVEKNQDYGSVMGSVVGDAKALKGGASHGLSAQTSSSESKAEYIAWYNTNAYTFLQQAGGNFGLDLAANSHVDAKSIALKKFEKGSKVLKICGDKLNPEADVSALTADFSLKTVRQVGAVHVRGWCTVNKEPILGKAESLSTAIGGGTPGHQQAGKAHFGAAANGPIVTVVDVPVVDKAEADEIAQALFDKFNMDWQSAHVVISGKPNLHAGSVVELVDFGTRFSGEWLVEGCQHIFTAGSGKTYETHLQLCRNSSPE